MDAIDSRARAALPPGAQPDDVLLRVLDPGVSGEPPAVPLKFLFAAFAKSLDERYRPAFREQETRIKKLEAEVAELRGSRTEAATGDMACAVSALEVAAAALVKRAER